MLSSVDGPRRRVLTNQAEPQRPWRCCGTYLPLRRGIVLRSSGTLEEVPADSERERHVLILTGTLNLLHRVYGRIAPGLRRVCIGTNILMTIFGVLSGVVSHAGIAGFTLVLGLVGGASALSLSRRALIQPAEFTH